jgi:hypothetical protein
MRCSHGAWAPHRIIMHPSLPVSSSPSTYSSAYSIYLQLIRKYVLCYIHTVYSRYDLILITALAIAIASSSRRIKIKKERNSREGFVVPKITRASYLWYQ